MTRSKQKLRPIATPTKPRVGEIYFVDKDDNHLKSINSAGVVTDLETGGGASTPAADSGAIATPADATAEAVAIKYNAMRTNLRAAGLMD